MTAEPVTTLPARHPIESLHESASPRTTMNIPPPPKPSASAWATSKSDKQAELSGERDFELFDYPALAFVDLRLENLTRAHGRELRMQLESMLDTACPSTIVTEIARRLGARPEADPPSKLQLVLSRYPRLICFEVEAHFDRTVERVTVRRVSEIAEDLCALARRGIERSKLLGM